MATIRTLTSAAAALLALVLSMPMAAQAKPPLNIIAAAKQDGPPAGTATKKVSKKKAAKRTGARKAKKRVRTGGKKSVRTAKTKPPVQAQPRAAETKQTETKQTETKAMELAAADAHAEGTAKGHIMRGSDSVSLIARLPWWRGERMQAIRYQSTDDRNQMVAAAEAWLAENGITDAEVIVPHNTRLASAGAAFDVEDGPPGEAFAFTVTSAAELNELDLAASQPPLPDSNILRTLIAVLGGALAAAASARFLFA